MFQKFHFGIFGEKRIGWCAKYDGMIYLSFMGAHAASGQFAN